MQEVDNVLRILKEARLAINVADTYKMRILSDQTVHTATIYQDPDNVIVAVLVYALSKIMQRENYRTMEGWKEFYQVLLKNLDDSIFAIEKNELEKFRTAMGKIRSSINEIESDLRIYIQDVFRKAELNKALKIYEHGLSAQQTAELLGVSLWDLSSYIGQSSISEAHEQGISVKERIKIAEEFFS